MNDLHHTTVELANCKLVLRSDLSFHRQEYRGQPCYLVVDDLNSNHYRIGMAEYNFVSLLDGSTTIASAVAQTSVAMGNLAITESDALAVCKWLIDSNLATTQASRSADRLREKSDEAVHRRVKAKLNPITPKIPLFNPDRWLERLTPYFSWFLGVPAFIGWLVALFMGCYSVWSNASQLSESGSSVLAAENWIWLAVAWIGLKLIHEFAHGITCKAYGGDVRQFGIVLIVLIPLPFVDVTSTWRFPSKWQRIFVAAAGMYVELFVAAIAAILWANTDAGVIHQQAFNVMIAGSVSTLLFNANPLMRFDGYYMLADWLEHPNLATHGQQLLKWAGKKFYLGLDVDRPTWPEGQSAIVATYAVFALLWRILICTVLVIAAESLLFGFGILMALAAIVWWLLVPVFRLLTLVFVGQSAQQQPSRLRFCLMTTALGMFLWTVMSYVPWYERIEAPAIVQFRDANEVRLTVGGFVREFFVQPDQQIRRGQPIARIENKELEVDVQVLEMQLATAELRARQFKQDHQIAAYQVEIQNLRALRQRLDERREQHSNLLVCSPADGKIIADDLNSMLGSFQAAGSLICEVNNPDDKELHALVSQHDIDRFQFRTSATVDIHIWGDPMVDATAILAEVSPRASSKITHPALTSACGGPLAVSYRPASVPDQTHEQFDLLTPRFLARVVFSGNSGKRYFVGQTGFVSFRASQGSIGDVLGEWMKNWIRSMRQQAQSLK